MNILKTETGKVLYFLYYMLTKPFKNICRYVTTLSSKPRLVLNFSLLMTFIGLFSEGFRLFFNMIFSYPSINPFFYTMAFISSIIYIWKYTSPRFGEGWKGDYNKLIKKIEENEKYSEVEL